MPGCFSDVDCNNPSTNPNSFQVCRLKDESRGVLLPQGGDNPELNGCRCRNEIFMFDESLNMCVKTDWVYPFTIAWRSALVIGYSLLILRIIYLTRPTMARKMFLLGSATRTALICLLFVFLGCFFYALNWIMLILDIVERKAGNAKPIMINNSYIFYTSKIEVQIFGALGITLFLISAIHMLCIWIDVCISCDLGDKHKMIYNIARQSVYVLNFTKIVCTIVFLCYGPTGDYLVVISGLILAAFGILLYSVIAFFIERELNIGIKSRMAYQAESEISKDPILKNLQRRSSEISRLVLFVRIFGIIAVIFQALVITSIDSSKTPSDNRIWIFSHLFGTSILIIFIVFVRYLQTFVPNQGNNNNNHKNQSSSAVGVIVITAPST